jgi:single-strand DNA-binding protein
MINKATLLGRVGKKEYKSLKNGSFLCQISVATSRKYIDSHANKREVTTWHNVNFFNKLADVTNKYVNVGDLIYIEGEICNRKIEENGVNRMIHSITGNEVKFIPTGRKDNPAKPETHNEEYHEVDSVLDMDDDKSIPF